MKRTNLILTLASLLVVILTMPGQAIAQDTGSYGIEFVNCPDELTVDQNDSAFYRIVAVPVTTVKACPPIHYYLVSGPGMIDSLSGLWIFHPRFEDPYSEEERFIAIGMGSVGQILVVVYTYRGEDIRLISVRRATRREVKDYASGI